MRARSRRRLTLAATLALASAGSARAQEVAVNPEDHVLFEGYPIEILNEKPAEEARILKASRTFNLPDYIIRPAAQRWTPGQLVRVAFLDGSPEAQARVETAALEWIRSTGANLNLSFRESGGAFRRWATTDLSYRGEIRIAFGRRGLWSRVGRESVDPLKTGGRPGHASMVLGGFDTAPPSDWRALVIHEFGHALGFEHEHQSPSVECGFRFENDSEYELSLDSQERPKPDPAGRRPGLYAYLSAKPHFWSPDEVKGNLGSITVSNAFSSSSFDRQSIMKYWFPSFAFEQGTGSRCYYEARAETLSDLDKEGMRKAYRSGTSRGDVIERVVVNQLLFQAEKGTPLAERIRDVLVELADEP